MPLPPRFAPSLPLLLPLATKATSCDDALGTIASAPVAAGLTAAAQVPKSYKSSSRSLCIAAGQTAAAVSISAATPGLGITSGGSVTVVLRCLLDAKLSGLSLLGLCSSVCVTHLSASGMLQ
ncbi:hypothetical protein Vafri_6847 [Volvox africanus]|uniref:Secreted protein n=1 Tax=Volvox africanus TaxID=51714 RepID=A0A8J4EXA6_9CHLO|nr:hypothetical protein Vafri_6847 [Volvox africanus]